MKTNKAVPSASRNMHQPAPLEVQCQHDQQHDEPVEVHHHQGKDQPAVSRQEEHGGYVYKSLGKCPTQGTVSDLLEWGVHTATGHRDKGPAAPAHAQDHPAAVQDQGVVCGDCDHQPTGPRRSTRAGRGETIKYQYFVQNLGASISSYINHAVVSENISSQNYLIYLSTGLTLN
jgi:hypothetical protein